jgi:hypothetical protein
MEISSMLLVSLLMLITGIFLSYVLAQEEDGTIIINQPIFAQLGIPSDSILLNKTNMTIPIAPTITENNTTITPAPEVNNTLIGRSTPTTSNTQLYNLTTRQERQNLLEVLNNVWIIGFSNFGSKPVPAFMRDLFLGTGTISSHQYQLLPHSWKD